MAHSPRILLRIGAWSPELGQVARQTAGGGRALKGTVEIAPCVRLCICCGNNIAVPVVPPGQCPAHPTIVVRSPTSACRKLWTPHRARSPPRYVGSMTDQTQALFHDALLCDRVPRGDGRARAARRGPNRRTGTSVREGDSAQQSRRSRTDLLGRSPDPTNNLCQCSDVLSIAAETDTTVGDIAIHHP